MMFSMSNVNGLPIIFEFSLSFILGFEFQVELIGIHLIHFRKMVSGGRRGSTGVSRWRHCSVGCCAFNKDVGLGQGQEHGVCTRCIRFEARELWAWAMNI